MSIKFEKVSSEGLRSVYNVEVPAETVEQYLDSEAQKRSKNFRLHGFRPGHAPLSIVRARLSSEIHHDALDKIISEACREIINQSKIEELATRPIYKPEGDLEDNKEFKFALTIEVAPAFELKPYDFEFSKVVPNIPQADIEEFRTKTMEGNPVYENAEDGRVIQNSDRVTYNAIYNKDGKGDASKNINNATVVIPSKISDDDKFSKLLIGKKLKEEFDFTPTNQPEVLYKISIEKIEKVISDLTPEDYAKKIGFKNLDEWDEAIKKYIENSINAQAYLYHKSQIIEALMNEYSFDLPKSVVEQESKIVLQQIKSEQLRSKSLGKKVEDKTDEELKTEYADTIDKRVLLGYIFNKIAKKENIVATDAEVNQAVYNEISSNPSLSTQIIAFYRNNPGALAYKRAEVTEHKVVNFLMLHAKTKEEPVTLKEINEKIQKLLEEDDDEPSKK